MSICEILLSFTMHTVKLNSIIYHNTYIIYQISSIIYHHLPYFP